MSEPTLLSENVIRFFGKDLPPTGVAFKKAKLREAFAVVLWEESLPKILAFFMTEEFARQRASVEVVHGEVTVTTPPPGLRRGGGFSLPRGAPACHERGGGLPFFGHGESYTLIT